MGMHPKFEQEDSFLLADILFSPEKLDVVKQLIDRKLVSIENLAAWSGLLSTLSINSTTWFKVIDYLKIKIDPVISSGGYISERSPLEIIANYKAGSSAFDNDFFNHKNFKGKTALDFGSGVYRPFNAAIILFSNGFDRVYSFEPFALKNSFPYASLMQLVNEMLVRPARFDFSGIGEDAILARVRSLDLRNIDKSLERLSKNEIDSIDVGDVFFTSNIAKIPDGAIDVHLSNAVLEHVEDMRRYSQALQKITTACSVGYHVVDYLDHRYYDNNSLSPFEKYYDGVLYEINGLTPSELEWIFTEDKWMLRKITLKTVPDQYFEKEERSIIARYSKYPMSELTQHLNCYEFKKSKQVEFAAAE
jgi:hypothetical protein